MVILNNTFPGFCQTDRTILRQILADGSFVTASGGHPGINKLRRAVGGHGGKDGKGAAKSTIQRRLAFLESIGAIECTGHEKGGRGLAPVYRICLENPHFVDYKTAPEKGSTGPDEKGSGAPERVAPETGKGSTAIDKGQHHESENGLKGSTIMLPHPPSSIQTSIQPPSKPESAEWLAGWISENLTAMNNTAPTTGETRRLETLAAEYGLPALRAALESFKLRGQTLKGLDRPWFVFLKESDTRLQAGQNESEAEARRLAALDRSEKKAVAAAKQAADELMAAIEKREAVDCSAAETFFKRKPTEK